MNFFSLSLIYKHVDFSKLFIILFGNLLSHVDILEFASKLVNFLVESDSFLDLRICALTNLSHVSQSIFDAEIQTVFSFLLTNIKNSSPALRFLIPRFSSSFVIENSSHLISALSEYIYDQNQISQEAALEIVCQIVSNLFIGNIHLNDHILLIFFICLSLKNELATKTLNLLYQKSHFPQIRSALISSLDLSEKVLHEIFQTVSDEEIFRISLRKCSHHLSSSIRKITYDFSSRILKSNLKIKNDILEDILLNTPEIDKESDDLVIHTFLHALESL